MVIAGDYQDKFVNIILGKLCISNADIFNKDIVLNKDTVSQYDIVDEESRKSAASAVGRAAVGAVLLGPVGLLAGVAAKRKGIYTIAIQFHNGKKSLIEIDEKRYKIFLKEMF